MFHSIVNSLGVHLHLEDGGSMPIHYIFLYQAKQYNILEGKVYLYLIIK
jgi:hypothetical protein